MKSFKRLTAVLLAVMLVMSMCITSFSAAEDDSSTTVTETTYVVAGTEALTGYPWKGAPSDAPECVMTLNEDGLYELVLKAVGPATGQQFKIVENTTDGEMNWYGDENNQNYTFNLTKTGDVKITFDPETKLATYSGEGVEEIKELKIDAMYAVGNRADAWLNGVAWNPAAEANKMTEISDNVYQIVMPGVEAYDNYEIKFAANGSWTDSWGRIDEDANGKGDPITFGETFDAIYNGQNIVMPFAADDDGFYTVTCTVDLNGFDYSTKTGGKITIDVEPGEPIESTESTEESSETPTESYENMTVYVDLNNGWNTVFAHYWNEAGASSVWPGVEMTNVEGTIYSVVITSNITSMIFNNNAGSQSATLAIPGDGYVYDLAKGVWYVYGEDVPVVEDVYVVAGSAELTGLTWDGSPITAVDNIMTKDGDIYTLTFTAVEPATGLQFKIVKNGAEWIGDATGQNYTFNVTKTCDVTITYNPETKEATFSGEGVEEVKELVIDAMYAVGNGADAWLNGVAWNPAAEANKMTEISDNVYQIVMTGVEAYDNYEIKFAANGSWTDSWGRIDVDANGKGDPITFGETFDAIYNGQNIVMPFAADDTALYTVTCTVDLNGFDYSTKTGGTITIDVVEEKSDVTIKLVAPKSTFATRYNWSDAVLYYGPNSNDITKLPMTATGEVFYTSSVGQSTIINAGDWKVYSITLTEEQVAAINSAKNVGFGTSNFVNRTRIDANVLKAGVDTYAYPYGTDKTDIANLDGYTFLIKDVASASLSSASSYVGYWMSDYVTVKMAAPVAQFAYYNWDSVDLFYNDALNTTSATKLTMFNTKETTKIETGGSSTLIKGGRWYIHALSLDANTAKAIENAKVVGFAKTGVDANRTNLLQNVLKAKTDVFDGTYNTTARTFAELEGQVFVIQDATKATSAGQFVGEWQTEEKYTQGKDDTVTIYFAAPKSSKAAYDWADGVELYYGSTALYKETERLAMTKTGTTTDVTVYSSLIPTVVSGAWDVYSLTLTVDQIKAIDEASAAGFVKKDSFNRTSIFSYRHLGKASNMKGDVKYRGVKQSMETFDGYTFIICDHYPTSDEAISYQGSWEVR